MIFLSKSKLKNTEKKGKKNRVIHVDPYHLQTQMNLHGLMPIPFHWVEPSAWPQLHLTEHVLHPQQSWRACHRILSSRSSFLGILGWSPRNWKLIDQSELNEKMPETAQNRSFRRDWNLYCLFEWYLSFRVCKELPWIHQSSILFLSYRSKWFSRSLSSISKKCSFAFSTQKKTSSKLRHLPKNAFESMLFQTSPGEPRKNPLTFHWILVV